MKFFIYILIIGIVKSIHGCTFTEVKYDKTAFGSLRAYCDYPVQQNNNTVILKVLPGSVFDTLDCKSCRCTSYGLSCCGKMPMSTPPPPECEIIMDGCEAMVVLKSNNQTDCYSGENVNVVRETRRMIRQLLYFRNQQNGNGNGIMNGNGHVANGASEEPELFSPMVRGMLMSSLVKQFSNEKAIASQSQGMMGSPGIIDNLLFLGAMGEF